jgi:hypothetical protein
MAAGSKLATVFICGIFIVLQVLLLQTNLGIDIASTITTGTAAASPEQARTQQPVQQLRQVAVAPAPAVVALHNTSDSNTYSNKYSNVEAGVDPIYIKLLQQAEERSAADYDTSHKLGDQGFVIGPTEGDFQRHTVRALQNARRIRNILPDLTTVKVALMTSPDHFQRLSACHTAGNENERKDQEACRLWANGTLFDHVVLTREGEFQHNDNNTNTNQGSSKYWLKALGGYRHAPYTTSIFLDSDAYPCPGAEHIFSLAQPMSSKQKYWQVPNTAPVDFAAGVDQFPFGTGNPRFWTPGDPSILTDYQFFAERNTGTTLFQFHRPLARTFAHFIPLVAEHVYNNVATPQRQVANDQGPFKMAHYLFQRLRPDFVDSVIPMHTSCRTYPGQSSTGTDGFVNGMFPLVVLDNKDKQQKQQHCRECSCTPCLVAHTPNYFVYIHGQKGWEENFVLRE